MPREAEMDCGFKVRTYGSQDQDAVLRLYHEGLLAGQVDAFDAANDLHQIDDFYNRRPTRHFWVADSQGEIVGTVAIATEDDGVAHLRRLRAARFFPRQQGVIAELIQTAVDHAREQGALKLVFHTIMNDTCVIELLGRLGFQFDGSRQTGGRRLLKFYVNLYDRIPAPPAADVVSHICRDLEPGDAISQFA
ncbi:MAG TPA: GNAT family N-acetyltransferase [Tepidisphaeraceae bacterium]|nr:GNAT family N-acetyltransferase [Tepidisphaeraceae bacterium]